MIWLYLDKNEFQKYTYVCKIKDFKKLEDIKGKYKTNNMGYIIGDYKVYKEMQPFKEITMEEFVSMLK